MEWTKLHTSLIVNRVPDKDILAIAKYQLLWAELEHEPDRATALRYMTANQLALAQQYYADIMAEVCADINHATSNRKRKRKNYIKNKENCEKVTRTVTDTVTSSVTDKVRPQIRGDKNRVYITTKTPLPPLGELEDKPLAKIFAKWLEYRKQIKKPIKGTLSLNAAYGRLDHLSGGDVALAEKIVNQSIEQGWRGLFSANEQKGANDNGTDYNRNPEPNKYAGFGRKI